MKINRLMQMMFVWGSVCAALPAFAASGSHSQDPSSRSPSSEQHPTAQCGGDSDDGDDGDDGDGSDDGDDGDDGDSGETIQL
jgi:hypothetical protein